MDKRNNKYYLGFEGKPEIVIYVELEERFSLSMWEGYFDNIMRSIKPTEKGWEGLSYYYNMDEGWYDESPWKVQDIHSSI